MLQDSIRHHFGIVASARAHRAGQDVTILVEIVKSMLQLQLHSSLEEAVESSLQRDATYAQHYSAALKRRTGSLLFSYHSSPIYAGRARRHAWDACQSAAFGHPLQSAGCGGSAVPGAQCDICCSQRHRSLLCCSLLLLCELTAPCAVCNRANEGTGACSEGEEGGRRGHHRGRGPAAGCESLAHIPRPLQPCHGPSMLP